MRTALLITGIIQAALTVLKLTDLIQWSWFWITSPIWVQLGGFLLVFFIAIGLKAAFEGR